MTQKACVRREGRRPRGEANHAKRMDSFHGQGRHVGLRSAPRVEPTRPAYLRRVVYAWPSCTTVCSSSNYAPQREWRKQREAPAGLQNFQRYKFTYLRVRETFPFLFACRVPFCFPCCFVACPPVSFAVTRLSGFSLAGLRRRRRRRLGLRPDAHPSVPSAPAYPRTAAGGDAGSPHRWGNPPSSLAQVIPLFVSSPWRFASPFLRQQFAFRLRRRARRGWGWGWRSSRAGFLVPGHPWAADWSSEWRPSIGFAAATGSMMDFAA